MAWSWGRGRGPRQALSSPAPRSAAYLSLLVTVFDAQGVHGPDDGCQGLDGVAVDDGLVLLHVFSREAIFVDDPGEKAHTTDECASAPGENAPMEPRPPALRSWLRAGSDPGAELLSRCIGTIGSEGKIYPNN